MAGNLLGNDADIKLTYAIVPLNNNFKGDEFFKFFRYANERIGKAIPDMSKATGPIIDMVKKVPKGSPGFTDINKFMDKLEAFKMPKTPPIPFAGWAMSIMFAGMAMQRMFDTIWKSSTKTFNDIMHSVEGTTTKFDILNGTTTYLGFVMGQALEPLAELLIPIVESIIDWVEQNPELVKIGTSFLAIGGAVLSIYGSSKLALDGLNGMLIELGLIKNALSTLQVVQIGVGLYLAADAYSAFANGEVLEGVARSLEAAGFLALAGGKKGLGQALVGVGIALQIVDVLVKDGGKLTPQSLADLLVNIGGLGAFVFPPVGAALLTVGLAFKLLPDKFMTDFTSILGIIMGFLFTLVAGLADIVLSPLVFILNRMIDVYNTIAGKNVEGLNYMGLSSAAFDRTKELIDLYKGTTDKVVDPTIEQIAQSAPQPVNIYYQPQYGTYDPYKEEHDKEWLNNLIVTIKST